MIVFLDTNVIMDVLAFRQPHYEHSAGVWSMVERGEVTGVASVVTVVTCGYLLSKGASRGAASAALHVIADTLELAACDRPVVMAAMRSGIKDFEDAVQAETAKRAKADFIVTRNVADFRGSVVQAITPAVFLSKHAR